MNRLHEQAEEQARLKNQQQVTTTDHEMENQTNEIDKILDNHQPGSITALETLSKYPGFKKMSVSNKIKIFGRQMYLDYLEQRYPRPNYTVIMRGIHGNDEQNFGGTVNQRRDIITESAGLSRKPNEAKLMINEITKESFVRITVDNYNDYTKLLYGSWREDVFGGVIIKRAPLENHLFIQNVLDNSCNDIYDKKNKATIDALYEIGICCVERDAYEKYNKDKDGQKQEPIIVYKPRLKCQALDMTYLVQAISEGVMLEMTGKLHKVIPATENMRPCIKCGDFNHSIRACIAPPRCTRCISKHHTIDKCPNPRLIKCFNCEDDHACNSYNCSKLMIKLCNHEANKFIIMTLLSEIYGQESLDIGYSNVYQLLDIRAIQSNGKFKSGDNNQNFDRETLEMELELWYEGKNSNVHTEIDALKARTTKNEKDIHCIYTKVSELDTKIDFNIKKVESIESNTLKILELLNKK